MNKTIYELRCIKCGVIAHLPIPVSEDKHHYICPNCMVKIKESKMKGKVIR